MKKIYSLITLTLLTMGMSFSSWSQDTSTSPIMPDIGIKNLSKNKQKSPSKKDTFLPALTLNKIRLYKILDAEFAAQREDWQRAFDLTFALAQETRDPRIARRASEIALNAQQPENAFSAAALWEELSPDSEEAHDFYIGFLVFKNDLKKINIVLTQRLKEASLENKGALILRIQRLLTNIPDKTSAFLLLEELLAPYKSLPETHLALARSAFLTMDFVRATSEAQTALLLKPSWELAVLTLAQITPDPADTIPLLGQFLTRNPQANEVRIAYGRILIEQKQYFQAQQIFKTLLEQDPENMTALYLLGMLSAQVNDFKTAEEHLVHYFHRLSLDANDGADPTQALLVLAYIAEERGDIASALNWLNHISDIKGINEIYLKSQIKKAQLLAKQGNLNLARQQLHEINTQDENNLILLTLAEAQLLEEANLTGDALLLMKNSAQQFPKNIDLLYNYAITAEKQKQFELMESLLHQVINLAPENKNAYNALGFSLADRNVRLTEALSLIEHALELSPNDPFILDSMGWVQFRLNNLSKAEKFLHQAYLIRPDAEIAAHLGEVLWVAGQHEAAEKIWLDGQNKNPGNIVLKNILLRFKLIK